MYGCRCEREGEVYRDADNVFDELEIISHGFDGNVEELGGGAQEPDAEPHLVQPHERSQRSTKMAKTYNSGYSLVVTHLTTNPPVQCLSTAERTGSSESIVLWSYVSVTVSCCACIEQCCLNRR